MSSNKSFSTETSDRYAKAVFELAQENNEIENLENEIKDLSNFYDTDSEFVNFITFVFLIFNFGTCFNAGNSEP